MPIGLGIDILPQIQRRSHQVTCAIVDIKGRIQNSLRFIRSIAPVPFPDYRFDFLDVILHFAIGSRTVKTKAPFIAEPETQVGDARYRVNRHREEQHIHTGNHGLIDKDVLTRGRPGIVCVQVNPGIQDPVVGSEDLNLRRPALLDRSDE